MRLPPWREAEIPCMASRRGKGRAARLLRRVTQTRDLTLASSPARGHRRGRPAGAIKEKPPAQSQPRGPRGSTAHPCAALAGKVTGPTEKQHSEKRY